MNFFSKKSNVIVTIVAFLALSWGLIYTNCGTNLNSQDSDQISSKNQLTTTPLQSKTDDGSADKQNAGGKCSASCPDGSGCTAAGNYASCYCENGGQGPAMCEGSDGKPADTTVHE